MIEADIPLCSAGGCEKPATHHFNTGFLIILACEDHLEDTRKKLQRLQEMR